MTPTRDQLFGYLRTIIAGIAGYIAASKPQFSGLLSPVFVDAIAGLLFLLVITWSHKSKS